MSCSLFEFQSSILDRVNPPEFHVIETTLTTVNHPVVVPSLLGTSCLLAKWWDAGAPVAEFTRVFRKNLRNFTVNSSLDYTWLITSKYVELLLIQVVIYGEINWWHLHSIPCELTRNHSYPTENHYYNHYIWKLKVINRYWWNPHSITDNQTTDEIVGFYTELVSHK